MVGEGREGHREVSVEIQISWSGVIVISSFNEFLMLIQTKNLITQ